MIRRATLEDLDHIIDLSIDFSAGYYHRELDLKKTRTMITTLIQGGVSFVSSNGFICGLVCPDIFRDAEHLVEVGWYATDRSGIKLFDAFVQAGRDLKVDEIRMTTLNTSPPVAEHIIRSRGFVSAETHYTLII
jgi:hypothetical protein|tara:strand:- start:603 stop:1004 length:402 start_codon:yes stop_codon:yes gene_type:complete